VLRQEFRRYPNGCVNYLLFNTRRPPFDDPSVRLAFAKSLDRDAYLRDVVSGSGSPALSLIPPGLPGYDAGDTAQRFDPSEARRLLASSRYGGTEQLRSIRLTYNAASPVHRVRAEWLRAQWSSNLGVTVTTEEVDGPTLNQLRSKAETIPQVAAINAGWCADYPDQQNWLTLIFHSKSNLGTATISGFADAEFDRLVSQADVEGDQARRDELYRTASRRLSSAAPVIFVFHQLAVELLKPWVRGRAEVGGNMFSAAGRPEDVYVVKHR
jgi:oligopeptide transport system substrate-binding protein